MSRTIGIEIEGKGIYPDACRAALRAARIPTTGRNGWKCKSDGTYGVTFEVASPAMEIGGNWQEQTKKVCEALRNAGARVSRACGIHVHVDMNDFAPGHVVRLTKIWNRIEGAVNNLLSQSRQANSFCKNNRNSWGADLSVCDRRMDGALGTTVPRTISGVQSSRSRYYKMNLASFGRHGTVEFRGHQGSLNATKIINWARLCASVVEWAKGNRDYGNARWNLPETLETLSLYAFNTDEELSGVTVSRNMVPRAGTKKARLFELYDANAHLGVREAATLGVQAGISSRKVATDTHWHWRKVTTVTRTVNDNVASANTDRRSSWVAYWVERASELEIDNQFIGNEVQDTSRANS